jgi:glycosyltransferase involved in cell wall biosynthesis
MRPGCRVLLNIAHYYQQKNLLTLLEAVDQMSHVDPMIRLILTAGIADYTGFAGERERREMQLARDLSRRGILADLGPVHRDCIWPLLQMADVFVFPSSVESFGHPLLEAMAAGTPIVASDTAIHREIAGDAAVFHHVFEPASLANAVRKVIDEPMLRSNLIAAGEKTIARFSWESHVQKLASAILRVAEVPANSVPEYAVDPASPNS